MEKIPNKHSYAPREHSSKSRTYSAFSLSELETDLQALQDLLLATEQEASKYNVSQTPNVPISTSTPINIQNKPKPRSLENDVAQINHHSSRHFHTKSKASLISLSDNEEEELLTGASIDETFSSYDSMCSGFQSQSSTVDLKNSILVPINKSSTSLYSPSIDSYNSISSTHSSTYNISPKQPNFTTHHYQSKLTKLVVSGQSQISASASASSSLSLSSPSSSLAPATSSTFSFVSESSFNSQHQNLNSIYPERLPNDCSHDTSNHTKDCDKDRFFRNVNHLDPCVQSNQSSSSLTQKSNFPASGRKAENSNVNVLKTQNSINSQIDSEMSPDSLKDTPPVAVSYSNRQDTGKPETIVEEKDNNKCAVDDNEPVDGYGADLVPLSTITELDISGEQSSGGYEQKNLCDTIPQYIRPSINTIRSLTSSLSTSSPSSTKSNSIKHGTKSVRSGGVHDDTAILNNGGQLVYTFVHIGNQNATKDKMVTSCRASEDTNSTIHRAPIAKSDSHKSLGLQKSFSASRHSSSSIKTGKSSVFSGPNYRSVSKKPIAKTKKRSARGGGIARSGQTIIINGPNQRGGNSGGAVQYTIVAKSTANSKGIGSVRGGGVRPAKSGLNNDNSSGTIVSLSKLFRLKRKNKNNKSSATELVGESKNDNKIGEAEPSNLTNSISESPEPESTVEKRKQSDSNHAEIIETPLRNLDKNQEQQIFTNSTQNKTAELSLKEIANSLTAAVAAFDTLDAHSLASGERQHQSQLAEHRDNIERIMQSPERDDGDFQAIIQNAILAMNDGSKMDSTWRHPQPEKLAYT